MSGSPLDLPSRVRSRWKTSHVSTKPKVTVKAPPAKSAEALSFRARRGSSNSPRRHLSRYPSTQAHRRCQRRNVAPDLPGERHYRCQVSRWVKDGESRVELEPRALRTRDIVAMHPGDKSDGDRATRCMAPTRAEDSRYGKVKDEASPLHRIAALMPTTSQDGPEPRTTLFSIICRSQPTAVPSGPGGKQLGRRLPQLASPRCQGVRDHVRPIASG